MVKALGYISGVQKDNGTYLMGNVSKNVQEVSAANTIIQYTRKKSKYKVMLTIPGPKDQILKVVVSIFLLGIVDSKLISDFICAFPVKILLNRE